MTDTMKRYNYADFTGLGPELCLKSHGQKNGSFAKRTFFSQTCNKLKCVDRMHAKTILHFKLPVIQGRQMPTTDNNLANTDILTFCSALPSVATWLLTTSAWHLVSV